MTKALSFHLQPLEKLSGFIFDKKLQAALDDMLIINMPNDLPS